MFNELRHQIAAALALFLLQSTSQINGPILRGMSRNSYLDAQRQSSGEFDVARG